MKEIATFAPAASESCTGHCQGCGKTHIKIFGEHNAASKLLGERVRMALTAESIDGKVLEIADPNAIQANGIQDLPALMIEGRIVCQGAVPSMEEVTRLLRNKSLFNSKLFQLRKLSVPVDMSEVSANALVFAWEIAKRVEADMEIVYAMDSIFEGTEPSASGFLSNYSLTMQTELDAFIRKAMNGIGVEYSPPARFAPEPGQMEGSMHKEPHLVSKIIFGAPDVALEEYSRQADLLVMGSTGAGGLGKKLFGSVSAELSKSAHCPVLFVPREGDYRGFQNILYASNFDSLNAISVQQAVSFAKRFEGQIHFVHVGPGGEKNLETQREQFESIFKDSGYEKPFVFSKMVSDDIAGSLYEYAFYHRIDLLVFVTRHRSLWENILHKSVTNEVLSSSDLPILVIHSDDDMT